MKKVNPKYKQNYTIQLSRITPLTHSGIDFVAQNLLNIVYYNLSHPVGIRYVF
jgi:hypothetical protein